MRITRLSLALLLLGTMAVPAGASPIPQPPELWTVASDGSTESAIATGHEGEYLSRSFEWSPDGTKLVFTKAGDIWTSNPDGTGQLNLTATDGVEEHDPHWSPDGTEVVFVATTGNGSDLLIAAADGSGVRPLTTDEGYERSPRWSPTGEWVLFQTICVDCDEDLELIRPDGSERFVLTDDDVRDLIAAWSPDGTQIAIVRGPGTTEGNELWLIDADGTDMALLETAISLEGPEWSPLGDALIARTSDSSFSIVPLAGEAVSITSPASVVDWDWSPDGGEIAFSSGGLWAVSADGSPATEIVDESQMQSGDKVPDQATALDWSPDGTRIAFSNGTDVFVWTLDGSAGLLRLTARTYATAFFSVEWNTGSSIVALVFQPVAPPGDRSISFVPSVRKLTFGKTLRFAGTVEAASPDTPDSCIAGVPVSITRTVLGESRVRQVADVVTDENGGFRIEGLKPDRSADYVATVAGPPFDCGETTSAPERVRVRKKVTLSGPPIAGGRVRLKADVKPCKGHRGDRVLLQKRKGGRWVTIGKDRSDDRCRAVFVVEIGNRSVFRAKAPKTDADHLSGKSPTLVIHVD